MAIWVGFLQATDLGGGGGGGGITGQKREPPERPVRGGDGELRGPQNDQLGKGMVDRGIVKLVRIG